jgi:hypothetical protein
MPINLVRVAGYLQAPAAILYTCPTATQAWVKTIQVINEDALGRLFELYADPGSAFISAPGQPIAPGALYRDTDGQVLIAGDTLLGWSDVADVCSYRISIVETS